MRRLGLASVCSIALAASPAGSGGGERTVAFHREVVNLDDFRGSLAGSAPPSVRKAPELGREVWYGEIMRHRSAGNVPFAVAFEGGSVVRARADANANGDLTDDPDAKLSLYPGEKPGRSFLVELAPARLVRVVVAAAEPGAGRSYGTQEVYGMLGAVEVDGVPRPALLYDADHDGAYARRGGDGLFLDLDGDRHFTIDVMGPDFGPLAVPFQLGRDLVTVVDVDPTGAQLSLRTLGRSDPWTEVEVGRMVPDFAFEGVDGRTVLLSAQRGRIVVIYFWSSDCAPCRAGAEALRGIEAHYPPEELLILGVSYDENRAAMDRSLKAHGAGWPSSLSGGVPSQDPVGRVFREGRTGVFYVIDADGRLAATTEDLGVLSEHLAVLSREATATRRRPRPFAPSRPKRPGGTASPRRRGRRLAADPTDAPTRARAR